MLPSLENKNFSLHSKKIVLLGLIAIVFMLDLAVMQSDRNFRHEMDSFSLVRLIPQSAWMKKARALVKDTPMEKMVPYLANQDQGTTAFLISVAKKESNWGKYSPKLAGQDCYNYWGYRGHTGTITPSGYTCFDSPEEAIATVGKRFSTLINESEIDTPSKMIVWKCGFDCSWDNPVAIKKWVKDVNHYYQKFYE